MPIIRNPFRRQDENIRPTTATGLTEQKLNGTVSSKPVDISEKQQPTEYQLSEINDSGVYLPPSSPERKPFWSTSSSRSTTTTSTHRSVFNENEQFNISRESFDSYRRSFDISARSPVISAYDSARPPRASLDSRSFQPPIPRTSNSFHRPLQVPAQTKEEATDAFEDVDIGTDSTKPSQQQAQKKRGLFSRMVDSSDHPERPTSSSGDGKSSSWHHFGGRKRGQSGQGAELGSIPNREATPKPESNLRKEQTSSSAQTQPQPQPQSSVPKVQVNGTPAPQHAGSPAVKTNAPADATKAEEKQANVGAEEAQEVQDGLKKLDIHAPVVNGDKEISSSSMPKPVDPQAPVESAKKVDS